ncbi:MAG: hypothetical protein B7X60_02660 [Polynucleobacter sp. 39-45-136]|nr:MAG: hypothetical protein B7X60_02660 [Polynucleobacter sp. 39-45-136]
MGGIISVLRLAIFAGAKIEWSFFEGFMMKDAKGADSRLYIRGCLLIDASVVDAKEWGREPEFFGLYMRDAEGFSEWVQDFESKHEAELEKLRLEAV